jgi:hypothetical protein
MQFCGSGSLYRLLYQDFFHPRARGEKTFSHLKNKHLFKRLIVPKKMMQNGIRQNVAFCASESAPGFKLF